MVKDCCGKCVKGAAAATRQGREVKSSLKESDDCCSMVSVSKLNKSENNDAPYKGQALQVSRNMCC